MNLGQTNGLVAKLREDNPKLIRHTLYGTQVGIGPDGCVETKQNGQSGQ